MKIKLIRLSGYWAVIGLIVASTMVLSACGSTAASSTTTQPPSSDSSTTTATNTITSTSKATKTTTTGKVTATLTSVAISQTSPPSLKLGFTQNFVATGTYSDGSTADVSSLVTWHSSDATIAAFTQPEGGLLTAMTTVTVSITATYQGMTTNQVNITVIPMPF